MHKISLALIFTAFSSILVLPATRNILDDSRNVTRLIEKQTEKSHSEKDILKILSSNLIDVLHFLERKTMCHLCPAIIDILIQTRKRGYSGPFFKNVLNYFCRSFESRRACKGYVDNFMDIFLYTIDKKSNLSSKRVCALVYQEYRCSYDGGLKWSIKIPPGGTKSPKVDQESPKVGQNQTFRILHLSDFHYDPNYTPSGNAACGESLCCQNDQEKPTFLEEGCGYWGDYREADAPLRLINETLKQSKFKNFDFVYFTGDLVPHRPFDTSIQKNTQIITKMYLLMKQSFTVPIFPVFGNHETHPVNYWPPSTVDDFDVQWLWELATDHWSQMVGHDVSGTVLKGGYYTVSPKPGFRIVALNNNLALSFNHWLMYDDSEAYQQLQWLVNTLLEAEKNNEQVHILAHVPVGIPEILRSWDREYSRIVERFASTITGQFNGHTHKDEFRVFYSSTDKNDRARPIGAAFNGASVTPFDAKANPSFKYYTVDSTSNSLVDYEEYTFNLTLANSKYQQSPKWYKLYSFRDAYGVQDLSPSEIDKVVHRMAKNHSLLDDYFRFQYRNADVRINDGCDDRCRRNLLCQMVTAVYGKERHCKRFLKMYVNKNV